MGIDIDGSGRPPAHARTGATIVAWRGEGAAYEVSWRMLVEERVEEELSGRQPFDEAHGRATPRAWPRRG